MVGLIPLFADDPHWREPILFDEYYHGDSARRRMASHQTGRSALAATLLRDRLSRA